MTESSNTIKDSESLIVGTTNKKDDSSHGHIRSTIAHYRREMLKRACTKYFLIPATIVFAVIGMISVTKGINSYRHSQRMTVQSFSFANGDMPLETNDPNNNVFDGHISMGQTRSINVFSKLLGVEPYGGPKTIDKLMENVADVTSPFSIEDVPFYWEVGGSGTIAETLCKCLNINIASTFGSQDIGSPLSPIPATPGNACGIYNVGLGTHAGTSRARSEGMITTVVPDFISSPFLPEIVSMFTSTNKARIITAIPNTKIRLIQSHGYLKEKGLFTGSFLEFVSSNHVLANNYLTHILSGKWGGVVELTEQDLILAADILKQKVIATSFSDHKSIIEYLITNKNWSNDAQASLDCMYPPENPWSKESASKPPPPPPPKSAEELAAEAAISVHNHWDDRLFQMMSAHVAEQGSII